MRSLHLSLLVLLSVPGLPWGNRKRARLCWSPKGPMLRLRSAPPCPKTHLKDASRYNNYLTAIEANEDR
jgi:hypothetical protein